MPDPLTRVEGRFATPANEFRNARGLTADQSIGAVLDAHGFSGGDIARYLGTTKQTVSNWRHRLEYQEEVERARESMMDRMGGELSDLRMDVMSGAAEAVKVLQEGLTATDSQGDPRWPVRLKAAEALLGNAVRLVQAEARLAARAPVETDSGADGSPVILVHDEVVRAALGMLGTAPPEGGSPEPPDAQVVEYGGAA